jgi:hypothetical protein
MGSRDTRYSDDIGSAAFAGLQAGKSPAENPLNHDAGRSRVEHKVLRPGHERNPTLARFGVSLGGVARLPPWAVARRAT